MMENGSFQYFIVDGTNLNTSSGNELQLVNLDRVTHILRWLKITYLTLKVPVLLSNFQFHWIQLVWILFNVSKMLNKPIIQSFWVVFAIRPQKSSTQFVFINYLVLSKFGILFWELEFEDKNLAFYKIGILRLWFFRVSPFSEWPFW